jgi:hypothetical protein
MLFEKHLSKRVWLLIGGLVMFSLIIMRLGFYAKKRIQTPSTVPSESEIITWNVYANPEADFTFKYPSNWEVIEDYYYESASGMKAKVRTVTLREKGDEDSNNWIRINPRQFMRRFGLCKTVDGNEICTYSENLEVLKIFNEIMETFSVKY